MYTTNGGGGGQRKRDKWCSMPIKSWGTIQLFTHNNFNQHCNPIKSDFSSRIFTIAMYNSLQKNVTVFYWLTILTLTYEQQKIQLSTFFSVWKHWLCTFLIFSLHTHTNYLLITPEAENQQRLPSIKGSVRVDKASLTQYVNHRISEVNYERTQTVTLDWRHGDF